MSGGGINRVKQHLTDKIGNATTCKKVPFDVRFQMQQNLKEIDEKRIEGKNDADEVIEVDEQETHSDEIQDRFQRRGKGIVINEGGGCRPSKMAKPSIGKAKDVSSFFAPRTTPGSQPSLQSTLSTKRAKQTADLCVAKWFYESCIPFNALNSHLFQQMLDAVAGIGSGYKAPSYHDLRLNLLSTAKQDVKLYVDTFRGR
jgi:hypothetical protein